MLGSTGRDTSLVRQLLDKQLAKSGGRGCGSGRGGHNRVVVFEADELGVRLGFTFAGALLRVAHSWVRKGIVNGRKEDGREGGNVGVVAKIRGKGGDALFFVLIFVVFWWRLIIEHRDCLCKCGIGY